MMRGVRFPRLGLRLVLALLAIESALQLGSWAVWRRAWVGPHASLDRDVVLVVGDDLCFDIGVGSRAEAWPAEVEQLLHQRLPALRIVNGAAPGRDSAAMLRRLERQLDELRPGVVCLRAGATDLRRGGVQRISVGDLVGRAAPFELRLRLPAVIAAMFRTEPRDSGIPTSVAGVWHSGDVELQLDAGGAARFGPSVGSWTGGEGGVDILFPDVPTAHAELHLGPDGDELRVDMPQASLAFRRGPAVSDPGVSAEDPLARGNWAEARWLLQSAAASATKSASAIASLVELDVREGRMGEVDALMDALAQLPASEHRLAATLRAWIALGRCREAVDGVLAAPGVLEVSALLSGRLVAMPDEEQRQRLAVELGKLGSAHGQLIALLRGPRDPAARLEDRERDARIAVLVSNLRECIHLCRFHGADVVLWTPDEVPEAAAAVTALAHEELVDLVSSQPRRSAMRAALLDQLDLRFRAPR